MQNVVPETNLETSQPMEVKTDLIASVVQDVWSSICGIDVGGTTGQEMDRETRALLSFVLFAGAWRGAVSINCSPQLARTLAAGMFGGEPNELSIEEVHDALGELVNIIGGNLKTLLPAPVSLSLPSVREEGHPDPDPAQMQGRLVTDVGFVCDNEPFRVTLVEGRHDAGDAKGERVR